MDDSFFLSAALIVLALALSGPAALLLALRQRHHIRVLERRLALVEARPVAGSGPITAPMTTPILAPEPARPEPVPAAVPPVPSPALPPDRKSVV